MSRMLAKSRTGYYGRYGGRFVPETLVAALDEVERAFVEARRDRKFKAQL
ncbi:partial Tryptophan synthase beta chain, partial [Anaerolineae bacterium]